MESVKKDSQQMPKAKSDFEFDESYYDGDVVISWETIDQIISRNPGMASLGLESHWMAGEKIEPWWRISDKDEFISFIVQKSLGHVETCDFLASSSCQRSFSEYGILSSSVDKNLHDGSSNPNFVKRTISKGVDQMDWSFVEVGKLSYCSEKTCRVSHNSTSPTKDPQEGNFTSGGDPAKSRLLEALCHSQSRARVAEMAARNAYIDKERVVELLLEQASHLFAYKQWHQLLQLECLYLQLRIKEQHIPTLLPVLQRLPLKESRFGNNGLEKARRKRKKKKCRCLICRYAFAFAVGLSLVGAGLLFGWSLGCLMPVV